MIKYPDGGRYEGNIRLGKRWGKYIFPSGRYEGRFRDDKIMVWAPTNGRRISFVKTKANTAWGETRGEVW